MKTESNSRLKNAFRKAINAAKRLWTAFVRAIRGREQPLYQNTGALRRVAVAVIGTVSLIMCLVIIVPGTAWGLISLAHTAIVENADQHAAEVSIKIEQEKQKQTQKGEATCSTQSNGSEAKS